MRSGALPRQGAVTQDGRGEVVAGMVLKLKGADSRRVIAAVRERMDDLTASLPGHVRVAPFYDQTELVGRTTHTIVKNLLEGGLLVIAVLACVLACGKGSSSLKEDGFSRTCATDEDCVLATFGDTCGLCNGSNSAIAKSAQASWQKAYNEARSHCPREGVVGKCAPPSAVSQCSEHKSCVFFPCPHPPTGEHRCASVDGGQ